jgi:3-polyprenyl-4-hydroxybenzoate decarboxylase
VAGGVNGSNVQLYMTGSGNTLWTYTDTAAAASVLSGTLSAFTSLAIASGSTAFRGVVLVPVPEPSTYAISAIATAGLAGLMGWRTRQTRVSKV